jgi:ribonuclease BN (tRNA processing enzyme)
LEAQGKAVLFTGDLRRPDADFPKGLAKDADLIICEGAHFPTTEYKPFLEEASPGRVIVNHYAPWNIPHIMELAKALPDLHITMATDGMEVNL